jgi:hypothetical protein
MMEIHRAPDTRLRRVYSLHACLFTSIAPR